MNFRSLPVRRALAQSLLLAALVTGHFLHAADVPKWNLLFVTADDMNADSSGWMGCKLPTTPNLDAFAATAHKFVNNHVTVPICQPGRSAFMTGRVPHRNGALGFQPITPGTPTLTSVLRAVGYFTAVIDKHVHMKPDAEFNWDLKLGGSGKNPKLFGEHVAQCLKAAADAGKPFFLNANITDPHRPFCARAKASSSRSRRRKSPCRASSKTSRTCAAKSPNTTPACGASTRASVRR